MIRYTTGDATNPEPQPIIIAHICNDVGAWGAGFVVALSKRWPEPELAYRQWADGQMKIPFGLGNVQLVQVERHIHVANMIAQHGVGWDGPEPPIRYNALGACLADVARVAKEMGASVHMPRIGCGLAGGDWSVVRSIIEGELNDINVVVYDFLPDGLPQAG